MNPHPHPNDDWPVYQDLDHARNQLVFWRILAAGLAITIGALLVLWPR